MNVMTTLDQNRVARIEELETEVDQLRAALQAMVGEAARIDHNLRLPEDFWDAYRAADELLADHAA